MLTQYPSHSNVFAEMDKELNMSSQVAQNQWCEILLHTDDGILELRWLPVTMTDPAFKASLALLALEAERAHPSGILIDALNFRHSFGPGVSEWRNDCIVPRYGAAGVRKFAIHMPEGVPGVMEEGGAEKLDGPAATYPVAWFSKRQNALEWLRMK
jgi:hypothetical protein